MFHIMGTLLEYTRQNTMHFLTYNLIKTYGAMKNVMLNKN